MFVDTHCHLQSIDINNNIEVIEEAFNNNIKHIIVNSYNIETSKEAIELSKKYSNLFCAIGIGPDEISNITQADIIELEKLIRNNKITAIGEIGLDYYHNNRNKEVQKKYFIKQLNLAKGYNLPVIIHCREAYQDLIKILKGYDIKGSIHCFSGSKEEARELIKIGYKLGIGGVVTYKNTKNLEDVVKEINIEDILLETDTPYLTPEPFRGKINRPKYIKYIAEKIAEIKGEDTQKISDITTDNATCLFDLK